MVERGTQVRIAVMEEQIRAIREQQRAHYTTTQRRFDDVERKMDDLLAVINRGRGAYAASLVVAGLVGGFLLKLGTFLTHFFQR